LFLSNKSGERKGRGELNDRTGGTFPSDKEEAENKPFLLMLTERAGREEGVFLLSAEKNSTFEVPGPSHFLDEKEKREEGGETFNYPRPGEITPYGGRKKGGGGERKTCR